MTAKRHFTIEAAESVYSAPSGIYFDGHNPAAMVVEGHYIYLGSRCLHTTEDGGERFRVNVGLHWLGPGITHIGTYLGDNV